VSASLLAADIGNVRVVKNQLPGAHIEFIIRRERRANADKRIASASRGGETQAVDRIDSQPPPARAGPRSCCFRQHFRHVSFPRRSLARDTKGCSAELFFSRGGGAGGGRGKNAARYYS